MIAAGTHELSGFLTMSAASARARLDAWLASQPRATQSDERDDRWWVQEVVLVDATQVELYDARRSNDEIVETVAAFVDHLAEVAEAGHVMLCHDDNGVHVVQWRVEGGVVARTSSTLERAPERTWDVTRARAHAERQREQHDRAFAARGAAQRFAELEERVAPAMRAILVVGGDERTRAIALDRLARVGTGPVTTWDGRGALPGDGTVVVPALENIGDGPQKALVGALQRRTLRVIAGLGMPANEAMNADRIRPDLYFRLSSGEVDLDELNPGRDDESDDAR